MSLKKIKILRKKVIEFNLDGYLIPKNDEYFSEYSSRDRLKYISGFDGSAGTALVLRKKSFLFVDGRYTQQAKNQSGKYFRIIDVGKGLPYKYFKKKLKIGYNPLIFTNRKLNFYFRKNLDFVPIEKDLVNVQEKATYFNKFYTLGHSITGEASKNKIKRLIKILKKDKSDHIFITAPENVAWLLNIRGKDNPYSPIPNCRLILNKRGEMYFFSEKKKILNLLSKKTINKNNFFEEKEMFNVIKKIKMNKVIIDNTTCSVLLEKFLKINSTISKISDPIYYMKSIKNKCEIKNMINAHIEDGIALTKFLYWIKNIKKLKITEINAQKKLENFRKKSKNYLFPSFDTISASGGNGSIIHYRATKKTSRKLNRKEIYLCDSGGQYKYGTTDVTRTISFGSQSNKIKSIFTKVLKGHIAVVNADISKLKNGGAIDKLARQFLKKDNMDYAHGTGHGIGFFLNVHEGPQSISKNNKVKIQEGMILSNEPGYYKNGKFGIRIENLLYVKKKKNKLSFRNLTLAPIDYDLVNFKLLSENEKNYLSQYHLEVYSKLNKYLSLNEKKWLRSSI